MVLHGFIYFYIHSKVSFYNLVFDYHKQDYSKFARMMYSLFTNFGDILNIYGLGARDFRLLHPSIALCFHLLQFLV